MSTRTQLHRRTLLRGLGVAVGLPWLEPMAFADEAPRIPFLDRVTGDPRAGRAPLRMAFFMVPNGAHMPDWTPQGNQRGLPAILKPLEPLAQHLTIVSGLRHDCARANGDGPGDHARANATFLTGAQAKKTAGNDIQVGISVDQLAASRIGHETVLPSIELGVDASATAGSCDSGYSCAYSSNISWRTPSTPMAKEIRPDAAFKRLFIDPRQATGNQRKAAEIALRQSVLDLVAEDAGSLAKTLGANDKRKLDQYLDSVRELEKRLQAQVARGSQDAGEGEALPDLDLPEGRPGDYDTHVRSMFDIMALAFQTDTTRIATFMYANEGSGRSYRNIGVNEGHHTLSHHGGDAGKIDAIRTINTYHIELWAHLLGKLATMPEGDGSVLDNCMFVYGSGNSDGDRHNHDNLPVLVAGKGGGTIQGGRHLNGNAPMCDLYLALLLRAGVRVQSFGDSQKPLEL